MLARWLYPLRVHPVGRLGDGGPNSDSPHPRLVLLHVRVGLVGGLGGGVRHGLIPSR